MPAPALKIPLGYDLDGLERQSRQMGSKVGEAFKAVGQAFSRVNGEMLGVASGTAAAVGLGWAQSAARMALSFATMAAVAYGAFKLVSTIVDSLRDDINKMIEIAEKSQERGISAQMFQAFKAGANDVKDAEGALDKFYQAQKSVLDQHAAPSATDEQKRKWTELEKAIHSVRIDLDIANGPNTFIHAIGTDVQIADQRLRGTIQTIKQLNDAGEKLVALDIAEKAFGKDFADQMRRGQVDINNLADTVENKLVKGLQDGSVYSDALVARASELKSRLEGASAEISKNLKPSFESLDSVALDVKNTWTVIVELMAKASGLMPSITAGSIYRLLAVIPGVQAIGIMGQLNEILKQITESSKQAEQGLAAISAVPLPKPRPLNIPAPEKKKEEGDSRDRFEASADTIEKRTAALNAETAAIDLGTAARERAKIAAELEAVAMQINARAGLGEKVVTDEQRAAINKLADAYGAAAAAAERARLPLATYAREATQQLKNLETVLASSMSSIESEGAKMLTGQQKFADGLRNIYSALLNDLVRMFIKESFTGPLAKWLHNLFAGGGGGGGGGFNLFSWLGGLLGFAGGTDDAPGGVALVGEKGPELVNLPHGAQVIPNEILRGMQVGGGQKISIFAPVTVVAPDPAAFHASRGQIGRAIQQTWAQSARRFA